MSSDSDSEHLMSKALPVGQIPARFDPSIPPTTAEEYLQSVMWESRQCKDIVTVELDKSKIKKPTPVVKVEVKMKAPAGYGPTEEVQKQFLAQFSHLREKVQRCRETKNIPKSSIELPSDEDQEDWCKLCFGNSFQRSLLSRREDRSHELPDLVEGHQPLLSILLNITPICLENLIEWHANWLEVAGFSVAQGRWFFSMLTCLEKPLTPELCSVLRHIVRMCAVIRATLESTEHPHLLHINMLITIVAKYFDQIDLADV